MTIDVENLREWLGSLSPHWSNNHSDDMASFGGACLPALPELLRVYEAWRNGAVVLLPEDREREDGVTAAMRAIGFRGAQKLRVVRDES